MPDLLHWGDCNTDFATLANLADEQVQSLCRRDSPKWIPNVPGVKDGAVIFCAASAPQALLTEAHAPALEAAMPVTVVDLGVPRNVSPALGELVTGLELVDLDRLKQWGGQALGLLDQALGRAHDVILQHCEHYEALLQSFQGRNKTE